jgi:hypothetical protein
MPERYETSRLVLLQFSSNGKQPKDYSEAISIHLFQSSGIFGAGWKNLVFSQTGRGRAGASHQEL